MVYETDFYRAAVTYIAKHLAFNHRNVFWVGRLLFFFSQAEFFINKNS